MKVVRQTALAILVLATVLSTGCSKPVPAEKKDYVGEWQSPVMYLLITQDGSVRYKRIEGGVSKSINGPLQEFHGDNFSVGISFLSTEFAVGAKPHQEGEEWKMVVDGVELTRAK